MQDIMIPATATVFYSNRTDPSRNWAAMWADLSAEEQQALRDGQYSETTNDGAFDGADLRALASGKTICSLTLEIGRHVDAQGECAAERIITTWSKDSLMPKITYNARLFSSTREVSEARLGLSIHDACDYIRELGERGTKGRALLIETLIGGENYQAFLDRTQPGATGGGLRIAGNQLNDTEFREDKIETLLLNHLELTAEDPTMQANAQQAAIAAAIAMAVSRTDTFVDYAWSDRLVDHAGSTYALFGPLARQLMRESRIDDVEFCPVIIDGRMLECSPEEGSSGVAYLTRRAGGRWAVIWLETCELTTASLPNA